ncbi:unnamed protein product [Polarella glacialis]|uniref:HECT-type E3 ubiquitin transferase n=1 Tax=Polarella glacialis TaxID=89957 RepID=A0A813J8T2_POLGL|nr:unnamed protein product [Polarella glacialis]
MTRLLFNLSLHPVSRNHLLGHLLLLLCQPSLPGSPPDSLPPPCLFDSLEGGRVAHSSITEVQSVGSQRVLSLLAYLLRRLPQCGEFFAKELQQEKWMEVLQATSRWTEDERRKKSKCDVALIDGAVSASELPGQCSVNLLLQLVTSKLYLSSSRHASWLLSVLHALLVPQPEEPKAKEPEVPAVDVQGAATTSVSSSSSVAAIPQAAVAAVPKGPSEDELKGKQRWSKIITDMHGALSQKSVLSLCNFLCQGGSSHGSSSEGDAFQMASDILVALAASKTHLDTVRSELMQVLATLVTGIEAALGHCETAAADPSTMETRFLRVVRTLTEVFREGSKHGPDAAGRKAPDSCMEEARVEALWGALDRTLERLDDAEVTATPAQRLLASGSAPSDMQVDSPVPATSSSNPLAAAAVSPAPPKPLLNRLLPLIEAFFVLHGHSGAAEAEALQRQAVEDSTPSTSSSSGGSRQVFEDVKESSAVERSRFGQFCKKHRRPLNALVKQTPILLTKSFSPLLTLLPGCLDFDNKRAYFRSQLRSRRLESRSETIRLRVRRGEIFMDSYHQLRKRTGEEMRAKIQVQFQGEEGIDAGGVAKEWYGALAKEIFNPNYALFVQAGGKACTYHPNTMSYLNRDHLEWFRFIGRIVGKAIHDGQNLEAYFTRGFYKHMLGRKVIPADLEAFDPEYFGNMKWMLNHDITDIVELNLGCS